MYAMVCTRTDLAYSMSIVSRFMAEPVRAHWNVVKNLMKYLRGSSGFRLMYMRGSGVCWLWLRNVSIHEKVICWLHLHSSWRIYKLESCLQKVVSLSPTEAEYVAATKAIQEALWLKGFMKEISRIRNPINCDNQSALFLMENPCFMRVLSTWMWNFTLSEIILLLHKRRQWRLLHRRKLQMH